jgi:hypothetical protein
LENPVLTIYGRKHTSGKFCDGLSRRNFLKVGGLGFGSMALPGLLRTEAEAGLGHSHKAVIMIFLPGGPPHQDLWDVKEDAPTEVRSEFRAINTNVPGIRICEQFPRIAKMMDKFIPIRSIVGSDGRHDSYQCMTGHKISEVGPLGGWPNFGAWPSHVQGPTNPSVPASLSMMYPTKNAGWGRAETGGYLGMKHDPLRLTGALNTTELKNDNMVLKGINLERLQDRTTLLRSMDRLRNEVDAAGKFGSMDAFTQQAMGILTTSKLADALDLSKEDPRIVERYGKDDTAYQRDGAPKMIRNFCVARRLVEAGARVVTLNFSRWDWHGTGDLFNYVRGRQDMPMLDQGLAALVTDLHERGLDRDVSVLVWGEFGRTPKINKLNSRDHWPLVSCAMMAGGGMRTGQVIGSTNRLGEYAQDRPVTYPEVFATLYHNMGIDTGKTRAFDLRGRPYHPVDPKVEPMRELV